MAGPPVPYPCDRPCDLVGRPGQLLWVSWPPEDCYGLFDCGTGLTHLINEFPATVLRIVGDGPMSPEVLVERLAAECGVEVDDAWRITVEESVRGLIQLELLERCAIPDQVPS